LHSKPRAAHIPSQPCSDSTLGLPCYPEALDHFHVRAYNVIEALRLRQ
jgi:hypothetical protein